MDEMDCHSATNLSDPTGVALHYLPSRYPRARSQGGVGLRAEPGLHNAPRSAYSGVENAFPPAAPAYGADSMMDRVAAGAAMGAAQAAMQRPDY
ncbi:hypothetical protein TSMEX_005299 [Taenia solium]|eukprot:TsM_000920200 transcript=TsM_000920200 gene=TsM_000920200